MEKTMLDFVPIIMDKEKSKELISWLEGKDFVYIKSSIQNSVDSAGKELRITLWEYPLEIPLATKTFFLLRTKENL